MKSQKVRFLGKANHDGSYSVSIGARRLIEVCWVDFWDDKTGKGYQRKETLRERRGKEIEDYFKRCQQDEVRPHLFEMTAAARTPEGDSIDVKFEPLDDTEPVGFVYIKCSARQWMSMIDGGTRLLGIERALASNTIDGETTFDVRLFPNLAPAEEVALFLLINEKQKRVRTDLGVRVVQRYLDEGELDDRQLKTLKTVVPETDQWKYDATRIAGKMNTDVQSPWCGLIQMPGDNVTKPVKLQAFWTSLKHLLADEDIKASAAKEKMDATDFFLAILKNFWGAVEDVNPEAREEPHTNVLWGSIGVNACHQALAKIVRSIMAMETPDLQKETFVKMVKGSEVADYSFWFTKKGNAQKEYPEKGEAPTFTGGAGYLRLANRLEKDWRSTLHAAGPKRPVLL